MSNAESVQYVEMPNMGRPHHRCSPVGIEHLYKDPDAPLDVNMLIDRHPPDLRSQHWAISWTIARGESNIHRVSHIVTELGCPHYTNWGPLTQNFDPRKWDTVRIGRLSLADRKSLEKIVLNTVVYFPNGEWNCQDWVIAVLVQAVEHNLFTAEESEGAIKTAQRAQQP
ncbi:hypothetical protein B0H13DRAFT_2418699 [Mycena leptocephala]|nr:hypothetical protein B0H13DRAFT_2418699 [Mycena leptocephala]